MEDSALALTQLDPLHTVGQGTQTQAPETWSSCPDSLLSLGMFWLPLSDTSRPLLPCPYEGLSKCSTFVPPSVRNVYGGPPCGEKVGLFEALFWPPEFVMEAFGSETLLTLLWHLLIFR